MARRRSRQWREPVLCAHCRSSVVRPGLCDTCFGLLPWPRKKKLIDARADKAPHLISLAISEGVDWLKHHGPAAEAARRAGERDG